MPASELVQAPPGEATADIRARCLQARDRALQRQGAPNQALQVRDIDGHLQLDAEALRFLHLAATRLGWSARATHRVLKVARTIADLAGVQATQVTHLAEAMQYRRTGS